MSDAASSLRRLRAARGFDAEQVAEAKLGRLARFFAEEGLDAAVVGVSGGVDSALVLALLRRLVTSRHLQRVVGLALPIEGSGATGQEAALHAARSVAASLDAELWEVPLGSAQDALVEALARAAGHEVAPWAQGQALSIVRTPALYGAAAVLQQEGLRSVVVGTTNRDEGAYLGFFGKASDAMVDVQPISDLHKVEVRALARLLGVPDAVVDAVPTGDVHDGRVDEELIGASYDDVELVVRLRELGRADLLDSMPGADAVERHHARNGHKYLVGSPARHLDVLPRGVPGGWADEVLSGRTERRPPDHVVPGAWDPPAIALDPPGALVDADPIAVPGLAFTADGVLTAGDCERLRTAMVASGREQPVGVTGVSDGYGIGSVRATAWSPDLAAALFHRLRPVLPSVRFLDERSATDGYATEGRAGHRTWRLVGLSPLLRFMRYEAGGRHLCHHDAGFDHGDGRRTLLSVVFYLSDGTGSGATRFVDDGQAALPTAERDFADWSRDTEPHEVLARVEPQAGRALVFDHRLCHDVERWDGPGSRVIVRGDVVYEAIPDGRALGR